MDYIEISGKTVDDALTEALVKLETTSDKVDVEVVEKGSSGILGLFNKPAVIRVRRKKDKDILEEDVVAEVFHEEAKKEEPAVAPATEKKPEMTREEVPLCDITSGVHYHTILAYSDEILDDVAAALKSNGFLLS